MSSPAAFSRLSHLRDNLRPADLNSKFGGLIKFSPEVHQALSCGHAVVALESTTISHGMPYPKNLETAKEVEMIVRENGAVPATVAILDGIPSIGLSMEELERLAILGSRAQKTARRDIVHVVASRGNGATTVSATMHFASMVGISVFVTGGIGGVHRNGENTMDISSDLTELGRTPVAVISAGVESILDIPRTLEYLETQGVCVAGYKTNEFPDFFTETSGCKAPCRVDTPEDCAQLIDANMKLKLGSGILIAVPIPKEHSASGNFIESAVQIALREARDKNITGNAETPFLLARVSEITGGASLASNIALVKNNALVGAKIAVALAQLREHSNKEMSASSHHSSYVAPRVKNLTDLHPESEHHVSRTLAMERVEMRTRGGRSNLLLVQKICIADSAIAEIIEPTGFLSLLSIDHSRSAYYGLLKALAEWWWDSTNTFHFPCGELTVTPSELTTLTGIPFGLRPLEFFDDWRQLPAGRLEELLGVAPPRDHPHVSRSWLKGVLQSHFSSCCGLYTTDQVARLCLLMFVGCLFCHTRQDTLNLNVLRSFEDLATLSDYDWGGSILCTMYWEMCNISRGSFCTFGGTSFIWELWAFEHFSFLAPHLKAREDAVVIPIGARWNRFHWHELVSMELTQLRAHFRSLNHTSIIWLICSQYQDLLPSRVVFLTDCRVLLRFGEIRMFYLGERVRGQITGTRMVPFVPPIQMRYARDIAHHGAWCDGMSHADFLYPDEDYQTFCREKLFFSFGGSSRGSGPAPSRRISRRAPLHSPPAFDPSQSHTTGSSRSGSVQGQTVAPGGFMAGPSFDTSSSVLMDFRYWVPENVPVYGPDLGVYDLPPIDLIRCAPFPSEGIGIPYEWARHTYEVARRLESALILSRTALSSYEDADNDVRGQRKRPKDRQ